MKALEGAFNQEALVGAFSVIVKTDCETDGEISSSYHQQGGCQPGPALQTPGRRSDNSAVLVVTPCRQALTKLLHRQLGWGLEFMP